MARQRPTLQPPANGGSILDEIVAGTANRPAGRPPFARDPEPAPTAPPAAVPAQPEPEEPEPEPSAAAAPAPARPAPARRPARPARARAARPSPAGIPEPPPGYIGSRKPLQVYVDGGDHWNLKYAALLRGTDMSKVVAAMVSAFVHDPDAWAALIARAEEERQPLGEILQPYLAQAVEDER